MRRTICPYCDIEISESSIEAEDGCCPECGAVLTASSLWDNEDDFEDDEFDEEFDDDDMFEDDEDYDDEHDY